MELIKNGAIPLYYQLKTWLLDRIEQGAYAPGDRIPTELELCERFEVSRGTVRQAIKELIAEDRLYMVRGRGTFVTEPPQERWSLLDLVSVAEAFKSKGLQFETPVLEISAAVADPRVASQLRIDPGAGVVYIKRLRIVEGEPLVIFTSYLPEKLASALYEVDLSNLSLYKTLEEVCGLRVVAMDHTLSVRLATEEEARLLRIHPGSPVHLFDELAFDADGNPIEYSQSIYRGDKSCFYIRSKRVASDDTV